MDDKTIQAAIRVVHSDIPEFISHDVDKHRSEQGAANNLRWIITTLVDCFDNEKRPPASLLYSLRGLSNVADLIDQAAKLDANRDNEKYVHKKLRTKAENSLLECFGFLSPQGAPSKDKKNIIIEMGKLLCPPVNDEWEPIGEPKVSSIQAAAKQVAKGMDVDWRTPDRAWKEYEKTIS